MLKILHKEDFMTTRWSGGTTTQLAIWPENAVYADRNFVWRLSSAIVEEETSLFTLLPSVARIICPLKGELELSYNGEPPILLHPYQTSCFWGGWKTESRGKVTDFNLMMREGAGRLESLEVEPQEKTSLQNGLLSELLDNGTAPFFPTPSLPLVGEWMVSELFYMGEGGETLVRAFGKEELLRAGDALLIQGESVPFRFEFLNCSKQYCRWVHAVIIHPSNGEASSL